MQVCKGAGMSSGQLQTWLMPEVSCGACAVVAVTAAGAAGGLLYSLNNTGFRWSDGFYFSVQAGLSIGFGSLDETDDASRYFSCYHVIAGGLLAGTFLGSWADALAESHDSWKKDIMVLSHDTSVCRR